MDELDDYVGGLIYVKNKLLAQGYKATPAIFIEPTTKARYQYLLEHVLISMYSSDIFRQRVKEIYAELTYTGDGEYVVPELYDVVDAVDEENIKIISEFFSAYDYEDDEIDNVIAHYTTDVNCMLDEWVANYLGEQGIPFMGRPLIEMYGKKVHFEYKYNINGPLNILVKEFILRGDERK